MREVKLSPSVFAIHFSRLSEQLRAIEDGGADYLHVDVMDGHFVTNMGFGADHIRMLKDMTKLPLDIHLMIERPEDKLEAVMDAGGDIIMVHQESTARLYSCLQKIRQRGKKAGVVLCPATGEESLKYVLDMIDMVLIMTINPGESGQHFLPDMTGKIARVRELIGDRPVDIEVDGAIDETNIGLCRKAGANVFVSGRYLFEGNTAENMKKLREEAQAAGKGA